MYYLNELKKMEKELVIIVDEEDNIIGYKERSSVKSEDCYRVSALWVESPD
jgi:hypothetical protein